MTDIATSLKINDTFNKELPADPILKNTRRQVEKAAFSYATPKKTAQPQLVSVSKETAEFIGLSMADTQTDSLSLIHIPSPRDQRGSRMPSSA